MSADVLKDDKAGADQKETEGGSPPEKASGEKAPEKSAKRKKKKKTAKDFAVEFLIKAVLTAAVVWLLCTFVIGIYVNHRNASYPMIKDGDLCITYRLGAFREGEEIAYEYEDEIRFGRIVAMPWDVVEIRNGTVTVNGYNVIEDVVYSTTSEGSQITYPYTVPENSVFVLNDYRDDVSDSRSFGAVSLDDTKGKVVFIIRRRGI